MDADEDKKHKREIEEQIQKISMAMYTQRAGESEEEVLQRAMRDPEIAVWCFFYLLSYISEPKQKIIEHYGRSRYAAGTIVLSIILVTL